jgi:hypothetical protein
LPLAFPRHIRKLLLPPFRVIDIEIDRVRTAMQSVERNQTDFFHLIVKVMAGSRKVTGLVSRRLQPLAHCSVSHERRNYRRRAAATTAPLALRSQIPGQHQRSPHQRDARWRIGCRLDAEDLRQDERHRIAAFPCSLQLNV